ncbi:trehalose-phosphatase [Immundisolibacter sp.]|uniref:trehalose-phosphatase n=1 Tax=Immundisolibacter sp. TaxID=1934948 RepID=UPI0019B47D1A|nr:trehalose-phosphatase [Immundisolibacter sp.]MBC7163167.1 trehalose-phosphatase [Immundisolibacter sp.]MEA3220792.1 Trehalose-phosphate phosphatase [Immundisolibacter sp.]
MPKLASETPSDSLKPSAVLVVSQRPRPGLGRILPSLEALGLPAVAMLASQLGDALPPPFQAAPQQVVVLAVDAESVRAAWRAGAGLVAGLGSGKHGASQLAAGAELLLEAPSEIGSGSLLSAYADKFRALPDATAMLAALAGRPLALLFDFDGTLAPVPDHPADGCLPPAMRELLARLVARHPLAVVSGRALADLAPRVALPSAYLAGNHGLELRGADYDPQTLHLAADWRPLLDAVHDRLSPLLAGYPGGVIEHKGVTISVHYRAIAPGAAVGLRRDVVSAVAAFDGLVLEGGRQVLEIRPAIDRDKGTAVEWLHGRMQRLVGHCMPIFFGDDLADEAAFRAARRAGGYGVLIARSGRPTAASCRLDSPEALLAALAPLLA